VSGERSDDEGDRKSVASPSDILTDKLEVAKAEASNGLRQFDAVVELIRESVGAAQFKLRPSTLLRLNRIALAGINRYGGVFRPFSMTITGSRHKPPPVEDVPQLVEDMCDYVNSKFPDKSVSALHLASYVMWQINWIHPFDDGNGRTARAASYLVLCAKLGDRLPGRPTIPELIVEKKKPYYTALEAADAAWAADQRIDLSEMEGLLEGLLAAQLLRAVEQASGRALS
jgi:Fic family protein